MNLQSTITQLSQQATTASQGLEDILGAVDINDPSAMLQVQFALQQYSSMVNYQSSLVKTVRDLVSGIISKI
ncbi:type III secretion system needle filament subunit SctF [Enterobacteriaceae bacterium H20N1]|uniref:Type III secretion system needle filament subunit SctF n=1 Tax=Dryocola boscaweniae TaxID=2925397 RepID=A0A9X2W4R4_9ENTR|nr:type III secretion system needle filament subunit SctF [Dryocola boscaweniae]MCT4700516.1 type III secretion system needle filament subunit SctF [Dryocola boscaweniae]MCT4717672.1 type III secretion system needle filament subunit SctF [Dryocola boscaweniae]